MKPKRRLQRNMPITEYARIDIRHIQTSTAQRDENLMQAGIAGLAASIAKHGLLQPVLVRRSVLKDQYVLVCGARRLEACRMNGMKLIHAMVLEGDEPEAAACWLEEHMTRRKSSFLDEAERICRTGVERVKLHFALPLTMLDERLKALALPEAVKGTIRKYDLELEQVQPLLFIRDEQKQIEAAELIAQRGLGPRQARRLVCGPDNALEANASRRGVSAAVAAIHETIRRIESQGIEAQIGMHSYDEGVCIQVYLKNQRFQKRSKGNS